MRTGQQHGVRAVGLVGLSTEWWFQLCVAVVSVVGQHWSSGLQHGARVLDVQQWALVKNSG